MVINSAREEGASLIKLYSEYGARLPSNLLFYAAAPRARHGEFITRYLLSKGLDPKVTSEGGMGHSPALCRTRCKTKHC
jgi:hypothetical protein